MVTKCVYLYQYKTGNLNPSGWEYLNEGVCAAVPDRRCRPPAAPRRSFNAIVLIYIVQDSPLVTSMDVTS